MTDDRRLRPSGVNGGPRLGTVVVTINEAANSGPIGRSETRKKIDGTTTRPITYRDRLHIYAGLGTFGSLASFKTAIPVPGVLRVLNVFEIPDEPPHDDGDWRIGGTG